MSLQMKLYRFPTAPVLATMKPYRIEKLFGHWGGCHEYHLSALQRR